ncbi:hypothetical protein [uncultured Mucilaginibacter sp.]|nr:hypothetical protein [uncultured Mucilaginibacter sp.]OJW17282.1 MAG: hypothetical protein BGO48_06920 [Mucilaginibacter sp. 44-25]
MRRAKIYSISTVGIIKHYVQDYLMHAERTDFVGANGVGKSIIADLLQLLFVYDSSMIRFGTDGVDNKERSIYTLPYKQPHAYFFINIEIKENQFITIGIMLSARTGTRILPFVITTNPELNRSVPEIALSAAQLLFARDFIIDQAIPDIKTLAQHFYEKGLYLKVYRTKDEVRDYYQFLNEKHITPINLTNEDNLKAFAKVIQSFSKAKSLDLGNSNSIKQFLFDDADKDFVAEYNANKAALEKLLRQYEELSLFITALEKKQELLLKLKKQEKEKQDAQLVYRKSELVAAALQLTAAQAELKTQEQQYQVQKENKSTLQDKAERLPALQLIMDNLYNTADENEKLLTSFEQLNTEISELEDCIEQLVFWRNVPLSAETRAALKANDIHGTEVDDIIERIGFAYPFLQKYIDWKGISEKFESQQRELEGLARQTNEAINQHEKWITLLEQSGDASLINWVLKNSRTLDKYQEAVLLKFFDAAIQKPDDPQVQDKHVAVPNFIENLVITEDTNGFWLTLGDLQQFITLKKEDLSLPANETGLDRARLIATKQALISELKLRSTEIKKVKNGLPYDRSILDCVFDIDLVEYTKLSHIQDGLSYVADIGVKIAQLETSKKQLAEQLIELEAKMTGRITPGEGTVLAVHLKHIKSVRMGWVKKLVKWDGIIQEKLKDAEKSITNAVAHIAKYHEQIDYLSQEFEKLNQDYFAEYAVNLLLDELTVSHIKPEEAQEDYRRKRADYERTYIEAVNSFEETRDKRNSSINMEQGNRSYGFVPLEEALLGSQIRHTDQIGAALQKANLSLLTIADNVRDQMGKIFNHTIRSYRKYEEIVKSINSFFKLRKISNRFVFKIEFTENKTLKIEYLQNLGFELNSAYKRNEIPFGYPVSEFIEQFFKKIAKLPGVVKVNDLLNPKTYFDLRVRLTNEQQGHTSGSTGETYSAIALLGIARLSLVETDDQGGLRFIILEETGSLDNINFSTFPAVAKEYGYQIITMAPRPFGITLSEEWYLHYLIKGKVDEDINHFPTASFFYTQDKNIDLKHYLKKQKANELD